MTNLIAQDTVIDQILSQQLTKGQTPSVQYMIFDRDRILYEKRLGFSNIEAGRSVNEQTSYHLYSITKTFTALAILQLAEKGLIDLDGYIGQYLPEFPYPGYCTVRQLLSHTAGIPNPLPLQWIHLDSEHDTFDRNSFFNRIFEKHATFKSNPGEKFRYSNLGYVILGNLIEAITCMPYELYIYENIIDKISACGDLGFEIKEHHATGYQRKWTLENLLLGFLLNKSKYMYPGEGPWMAFRDNHVNGAAYGGLKGTATGLRKYLQALLDPDHGLISDKYLNLLFTENTTNAGKRTGMGLSWYTGNLDGHSYFTHAGGGGGYYCEIRIYRDRGLGSIILFNRSGMSDERFLDKLDQYFLDY